MSNYRVDIKDNTLVFETSSFRAERGSILHSGIYNRELSASLAAGACITLAGFFFAGRIKISAVYFFAALVFFVLLFLAFRTYVFRDSVLRLAIDKETGNIAISMKNIFAENKVSFSLGELDAVRQDHVALSPENPDGVKVVEKIALQHGTVIPGFGKTVEFYTVELGFKSGKRLLIFSSREPAKADAIAEKLKNFIDSEER